MDTFVLFFDSFRAPGSDSDNFCARDALFSGSGSGIQWERVDLESLDGEDPGEEELGLVSISMVGTS
jgi:hypothetical protein